MCESLTLTIVTQFQQAPFIMRNDSLPDKYEGYCIDLLKELKNLMSFEYELYEVSDGQYGRMNEMSEWNGMVKELMDKVI